MAFDQSGNIGSQFLEPVNSSASSAIDRIREHDLGRARPMADDVEAALRMRGIPFHEEILANPDYFDTPIIKICPGKAGQSLPTIGVIADSEPYLSLDDSYGGSLDDVVSEVCSCCAKNGIDVIQPAPLLPVRRSPFAKLAKLIPGRR